MVDLRKHQIVLGDKIYPITGFAVWWIVSDRGLYPNLNDALATGMPIQSVPVALASDTIISVYEVIPPELQNESRSE